MVPLTLFGVSPTPPDGSLRTAEVIATTCLATDLAMGFPLEHGFHATLMTRRLCDVLGVDDDVAKQAYFGSMLTYSGCTAEPHLGEQTLAGDVATTLVPHLFGGTIERTSGFIRSLPSPGAGPLRSTGEIARRLPRLLANTREHQAGLCEVAESLSRRLDLPQDIPPLFRYLTERWDGKNVLRRADGDEIPMAVRIFVLVRDIAYQRLLGGDERAIEVAKDRAGKAFDPQIVDGFVSNATDVFDAADDSESGWSAVLDAEPKPRAMLTEETIDAALAAIGDFADLMSPSFTGHAEGLADLVTKASNIAGMTTAETRDVRRAALVHDVGRVAISQGIWEKTKPLTRDEQEQVRLHPYHTERVLSQSSFFEPIRNIARDHHERLDGSGYHRGIEGASLGNPARLLAAADAMKAMTEPRPHRAALDLTEAAEELARLAGTGRLDHAMVAAVIEAAGEPIPRMERPAGLTERETEVIALIARGLQTKQVATALGISPKTADTHIQNAYRKMEVSTRAAAALFAMEHALVPRENT